MSARLGSVDRFAGGQIHYFDRVIIHERYEGLLNDVALLRLKKPLIYSENIQPIELMQNEVPANEIVTMSGWGRLETLGDLPQKLQWLKLPILNQDECNKEFGMKQSSLVCMHHSEGQGACFADSGGPAVYKGKQIGIFNFVKSGCGTEYADASAKVSFYYDWIKTNSDL